MRRLLLPYQTEYLRAADDERYLLVTKSRQIGLTFVEALWSLRRRLKLPIDHYYVSSTERTAKQFIRYVKLWADVFNVALSEEVIELGKDATLTKIHMPNGSIIQAMPSGVDVLRGLRGDVTLDEAAVCQNAQDFFDASMPATVWGGNYHVISTAGLPGCWFEEERARIATKDSKFREIKITIHEAIKSGLADFVPGDHRDTPPGEDRNKAFLDHLKRGVTPEAFAQEYECLPRGLGSLITSEEYQRSAVANPTANLYEYERMRTEARRPLGPLYIGVDIGRVKDLTCIYVLEKCQDPEHLGTELEDVYVTILVKVIRGVPYGIQKEQIKPILGHPSVELGLIDSTGIGNQLAEELTDELGGNVRPFVFTNNRKGVIAERIRSFMQQDRLALPPDKDIELDFTSIVRSVTNGGRLTYSGSSSVGHSDRFWACGMALEAAEAGKVSIRVSTAQSVKESRDTVTK